jgi:hypothetical protein
VIGFLVGLSSTPRKREKPFGASLCGLATHVATGILAIYHGVARYKIEPGWNECKTELQELVLFSVEI